MCCPKFCGGCDEVQCQLRQARCCPAQIYKAGRACRGAGDAGCVFPREADNGTFAFCRGNARGAVGDAATCCPARCGRCDAACAGDAACCGAAVAAAGRACAAADDVGCVGPRPELDVGGFKGAAADDTTGDVHVVIAGDRVQSLGVVACASSLTRKAKAAREEACLRRARDDASAYARHLRRVVAKKSGTARPRVANL